jgi:hypothetical protein
MKLMSAFDKICALLSIGVGVLFMVLGVIGFMAGSSAHFTLPPIIGGLPFFLGWGMSVPLIKFWSRTNATASRRQRIVVAEERPNFSDFDPDE